MRFIIFSVFIIFSFYSPSFSQEDLKSIAGYEYAKYNDEWFTVVDNNKGDQVDLNRLVVRLRDKREIETYDFDKIGFGGLEIITPRFVDGFYQLKIPQKADPFRVAKVLEKTGDFDVIHFSVFYKAHVFPNDQYFGDQWGLHNIGQVGGNPDADIDAPEAWDITTGNSDILISIIDAGIDYYHEELDGNIWSGIGYDFYNGDPDPFPDDGAPHGTAVAGISSAQTNNSGIGIAGVGGGWEESPGASLMIMDAGYFDTVWWRERYDVVAVALATEYSAQWGAKVINMSFGGQSSLPELESAIDSAVNNYEVVIVASAGNSGGDDSPNKGIWYPAKYSNTIAVGATVRDDSRWSTSGWEGSSIGQELDVLAPGGYGNIYTTDITGVQGYSTGDYHSSFGGTSASAPHVSGTAALMRSVNPSLTWDEVRNILRKSTDKVPGM